jgi:CubicO group peptidase (beta-lactamase class C family)
MQAPLLSFTPSGGGPTRTCTPGQFYHYSTHGFTFVGAFLEKVLDQDIHTIIRERIAVPYALESLRTVAPLVSIGGTGGKFVPRYDMAQGYGWTAGTSQPVAYEDSSWKVLGGGLQIDALDLARFGWLVLHGDVVSPQTRDGQLWRSRTGGATLWPGLVTRAPDVGLGWDLREVIAGPFTMAPVQSGLAPAGPLQQVPIGPGPRRVAEHGGIADGARSQLTIFRDDGLVIAILTNQRNSAVTGMGHPIQGLGDQLGQIVLRNPPR